MRMISVTNLSGHTEPLNDIRNFEMNEEVSGNFVVSFISLPSKNNPGHDLLEEEAIITVEGYDFRIKQFRESHKQKRIVAVSTFYDLVGVRREDTQGGTKSFDEFASFIFLGTGWTYSSEVTGSELIPGVGNDNIVKLTQEMCSVFECEYQILPNNHIHFSEQIGPDKDAQYRFGHNVKTLSRNVDTSKLRTRIKGYGADGLEVTYMSPNADKFGIRDAEPIIDERFSISDNLLAKIKRDLIDYPEVNFELDVVELSDKEIGERVWLIYEPMGIEFQVRVMAKKTTIRNGKFITASVVIGNAIQRTMAAVMTAQKVAIDDHRKRTQSRFERTNERINLEVERLDGDIVEAYSHIEQTADGIYQTVGSIKLELEGGIADARSYIDQTAISINLGVDAKIERVDADLGVIREEASSNFSILAGQIVAAVSTSKEYSDSKIDLVNASIDGVRADLTSVEGRFADNIGTLTTEIETLQGSIVSVNETATANFNILSGSIEAAVSTSKTYTDSVKNTVESTAESNFNILSGRIDAKAESTTVSSLGTRVTTAEQSIDGISGQISNKVSYTDYNGNTIASLFNQTATTIKLQASKIEMLGITEVANTLYIGGNWQDSSTEKTIQFRGSNGGATISSPSGDWIKIDALSTFFHGGSFFMDDVNFNGKVDFSNAAISGLYARFG
ncbi:phage tail protein [Sporosarcina highlanderae]|uniref:Phage tail protein n=1 Tax=Sporosarcina highlanderae TaxID=3035916 RepID=A0ABT8JW05_9BACL|nr:phage tail protein [Sporosarcina highlanderae]MDN4609117.1 phage tail protein [Sporosarcina highlanderae]